MDVPQTAPAKSKKNRKKKASDKSKAGSHGGKNGSADVLEPGTNEGEIEEPETPTGDATNGILNGNSISNAIHDRPHNKNAEEGSERPLDGPSEVSSPVGVSPPIMTNGSSKIAPAVDISDTETKLEALTKDRDLLRQEVEGLRKSLEQIHDSHHEELSEVRQQLDNSQAEKEHAEIQYRNLLGKVNTIKSQLGERLKADAEDLSQARTQIEDLEEQNRTLTESSATLESERTRLVEDGEQRSKELSSLRNRTNLSQQNWSKEREDLLSREAFAKEEFEAAKQAMQDWEVLAMEERSVREALSDRASELEEQLSSQKEAYERASSDRDTQSLTVEGLQRALQEIQEARKRELREIVESSQAQVEELRNELQNAEKTASESGHALDFTRKELERASPFEKEVKEKNLLIGKLRHEAVILNDHLTKALRFLKKGKPEDNIDRQIVTNHFLHFLALDRADPKKFQVLQLIAALLNWTEEQREQAGLARPGASNSSLRAPLSPFHRTPSTPVLSTDLFPENNSGNKESLAELWSNFLEQEAEDGSKTPRSASISSIPKA
ncbi:MAG: hypothetical protein M1812_005620 [Candelaria pacifica]|nr:MAG: hypothetical protein M1812_005620 [Candelaria pacifica]